MAITNINERGLNRLHAANDELESQSNDYVKAMRQNDITEANTIKTFAKNNSR
jgi:hypothetical protein